MDRSTVGYTQMGGEGANWIGEAPFSSRPHVFQNLGDGTYNHSGYMAIRAAIAAGVNITYKILFNDAVAMTGGQPNEGGLTVPQIARQVAAEGARRVVVVTDEPWKYAKNEEWPRGLTIHHRDGLLPLLRQRARRQAQAGHWYRRRARACPTAGAEAAGHRQDPRHHRHRRWRHRDRHHRRNSRHGGPSRRQGGGDTRYGRPRAEG